MWLSRGTFRATAKSHRDQRQIYWKLFMADATKVELDYMASWHTGEQLEELLYN
jgi:hypothetical protein